DRSGERVQEARGRGGEGVRAEHLLRGKAHLRARALVGPRAAQRDGVPDPAALAVRGVADGRPAGARAGGGESIKKSRIAGISGSTSTCLRGWPVSRWTTCASRNARLSASTA